LLSDCQNQENYPKIKNIQDLLKSEESDIYWISKALSKHFKTFRWRNYT